ncbi:MAG: AAA family ATPase [Proteobacteria bacterium]|nr:AAA family ATPase [Pseudomonadota bacterium]NBP12985.1 AAA family ATPase [bacterium]
MFSQVTDKTQSIRISGNTDPFYNVINDNEFPIRRFIEKKYGTALGLFYTDDEYTGDVFRFLMDNGKLLSYTSVGKLSLVVKDTYKGLRGGTFWFYYKNVYIRISLKDQPDDVEASFANSSLAMPPGSLNLFTESEEEKEYNPDNKIFTMTFAAPVTVDKFPIEDFEKFILQKTKGRVHIFIKNQYGEYDFEPIKLESAKDLDLTLNYGEKFVEINDVVTTRLKEKPSGLYMFHGSPGTGKTTYIKYLANIVDRDFIYVPTNMLEYFTTDPNSLSILLRKPNSVLVLEDAEKAIMKREDGGSNSSVSSLLNLSDGIMSDIMKTAIILTYNCSKQDIDEALRRKGRLQIDYEFTPLPKKDAIRLAETLNYPKDFIKEEIKDSMSLADIYNLQTKIEFQEKKEKHDRIVGFGK